MEPTPWFVGGGAQHSPEVARLLAYVASSGKEGVIGWSDLRVSPLATPGGGVRVNPGACVLLNRSTGGAHQAYAGRNAVLETVTIDPTDSLGGRSDLVIVRVEDPQYSPWSTPADPVAATYIRVHVIKGVPATTKTAAQLNLGYPAIALARIDLPSSTGTVTQAMIVNLREQMYQEVQPVETLTHFPTGNFDAGTHSTTNYGDANWRRFPTGAAWSIAVPEWAVRLDVFSVLAGIASYGVVGAFMAGGMRAVFGGTAGQYRLYSGVSTLDGPHKHRQDYNIPCSFAVPESWRGTTKTLEIHANRTSGAAYLVADYQSSVYVDLTWVGGTA